MLDFQCRDCQDVLDVDLSSLGNSQHWDSRLMEKIENELSNHRPEDACSTVRVGARV